MRRLRLSETQLIDLLSDLPDYVCLVFYFDILEAKPDKRTKMYKAARKTSLYG